MSYEDEDLVDDPLTAAAAAEAAAATEKADAAAAAMAAASRDGGTVEEEDKDQYNKWNKNGFGEPVAKQSGKYSKEESEQVRKAVEEFCAAKQISTARLCSECDHKADLKGAWMEIAKRVPHRSVQSVYRHGIRRLHPFKRGAWSDAECNMLVDLVTRLGKKWSTIQGKLNRSADSCRDKYREMSDEFVKGRWKDQETEILKNLIREQVGVSPQMDMNEVGIIVEEQNIQIPWSVISKRMGKRSRLSCFKKWQKLIGAVPAGDAEEFEDSGEEDNDASKRKAVDDPAARKRTKNSKSDHRQAPTAGAAAAMAIAADGPTSAGAEYDDVYSAKMADSTIEAVGLPDARSSFV
eukprot:CAMPEP_0172439974 /NCGR_PEP_ID=MMETSP1065-20121228/795_1 /TAXON_ID=265537 /ORGANISM="Amphiprora paludosa, Strain CCMP125" /LENGTH=350 /DNA_ID=CAMNT_0013188747 /DNA_START=50 /DNA_END=1102 /DNA_ORIENTATION=-